MKNIFKTLALLALWLFVAGTSLAQQNLLVQTTLSAAVPAPTTTTVGQTTLVQIASATGITGIQLNPTTTLNQQNQWIIFIDREAMAVVSINGTTLSVLRGWNSTQAAAHVSGTMVLYGRAAWFYSNDPGGTTTADGSISGVPCTQSTIFVSPWLNVRNGAQWICSATTGTYIPGWNNNGVPIIAGTQASVAGSTPVLGPFFQISGTNAITGFTIPLGFNATAFGGGCFVAMPTGIWTWTAAGNISVLGTVTAATFPVTFCWNAATSKWNPSRVS